MFYLIQNIIARDIHSKIKFLLYTIKKIFPIYSLMMLINLIQCIGTVGMFNNCHIAGNSLNYSYFSDKYHNSNTFTMAIELNMIGV